MKIRPEEKRNTRRITYARPVSNKILGQSGHMPNHGTVSGDVVDLSNGGMRMRTAGRVLPAGAVVRTQIAVSKTGVSIPVLAQVQWVKREKPGSYQVGLRFVL